MIKVKTLHSNQLRRYCVCLEDVISNDFHPDLVIGIAEGGAKVAQLMFKDLPHLSVKLQRPGTPAKQRAVNVMNIVRKLPDSLKNGLRIAEAVMLELKGRKKNAIAFSPVNINLPENARNIIVIDDAVDSGTTLSAVLEGVRKAANESKGTDIRSAVLTVTTRKPLVMPDYFIFNNHTLLRFPWSADYQNKSAN